MPAPRRGRGRPRRPSRPQVPGPEGRSGRRQRAPAPPAPYGRLGGPLRRQRLRPQQRRAQQARTPPRSRPQRPAPPEPGTRHHRPPRDRRALPGRAPGRSWCHARPGGARSQRRRRPAPASGGPAPPRPCPASPAGRGRGPAPPSPARGPATAASTHTPASAPSPPRRPCRQTPAGSASPRSCSASRHLRPGSTTAPGSRPSRPPGRRLRAHAGPRDRACPPGSPRPLLTHQHSTRIKHFLQRRPHKETARHTPCGSNNSGGLRLHRRWGLVVAWADGRWCCYWLTVLPRPSVGGLLFLFD